MSGESLLANGLPICRRLREAGPSIVCGDSDGQQELFRTCASATFSITARSHFIVTEPRGPTHMHEQTHAFCGDVVRTYEGQTYEGQTYEGDRSGAGPIIDASTAD